MPVIQVTVNVAKPTGTNLTAEVTPNPVTIAPGGNATLLVEGVDSLGARQPWPGAVVISTPNPIPTGVSVASGGINKTILISVASTVANATFQFAVDCR